MKFVKPREVHHRETTRKRSGWVEEGEEREKSHTRGSIAESCFEPELGYLDLVLGFSIVEVEIFRSRELVLVVDLECVIQA